MLIAQQSLRNKIIKLKVLGIVTILNLFVSCKTNEEINLDNSFFTEWNNKSVEMLKQCSITAGENVLKLSLSRILKAHVRYNAIKKHQLDIGDVLETYERLGNERYNYITLIINQKFFTYEIDLSKNYEISLVDKQHNYYVDDGVLKNVKEYCKQTFQINCDDLLNINDYLEVYSKVKINTEAIDVINICLM